VEIIIIGFLVSDLVGLRINDLNFLHLSVVLYLLVIFILIVIHSLIFPFLVIIVRI